MKHLDIKKIIEYGLYLLVFLLPLQTRWILRPVEVGGWDYAYGSISIYGIDILLVILIALFAWERKKELFKFPGRVFISGYWLILAGLELMVFISILVAADIPAAIYGYVNFLLGIGLMWIVFYGKFDKVRLVGAFLAGAVVQSVFGIWQFLAQSDISSKWLGMAMHNAGEMGASVVETLAGGRWLRAYGTLDHPNILGGYLVIAILLAVYLYVSGAGKNKHKDGTNTRSTLFKLSSILSRHQKPILVGVVALLFVCLFFTFSRTAWAGLLVGLITFFAITLYWRQKHVQKKILKVLAVLAVLSAVLFGFYSELVISRLSQDTYTEIKSTTERMSSYEIAAGVVRENLFLGAGIRNYGPEVENMAGAEGSYYMYQPVHNVFLLVLAEIGLLGVIMFVAVLQYIFSRIISATSRKYREKQNLLSVVDLLDDDITEERRRELQDNISKGEYGKQEEDLVATDTPPVWPLYYLSILFAIIVMFMADHWWWSLHFGVLLFWFVVGLMLRESNNT